MAATKLLCAIESNRRSVRAVSVLVIVALLVSVYFLVLSTGPTFVFANAMYLPIVIASVIFGCKGGVLTALVGGLMIGPFIPLDLVNAEPQAMYHWLYRSGFYTLIGIVVGLTSDAIRRNIKVQRKEAKLDRATGLSNYAALEEELARLKVIEESEKGSFSHCIVVIYLSNAQEIVSHFGLSSLDKIILQMSERFKLEAPLGCVVYRIRPDQLGILLRGKKEQELDYLCGKLRKIFLDPFFCNKLLLHGDIFTGGAKFSKILNRPEYYIQRAVAAALRAETDRVSRIILLSKKSDEIVAENLRLLGDLNEALHKGHLQMHFQPKIELDSGAILHAEALMRWHHPRIGYIPPVKFIPRAERSTLIGELTAFAIDRSLQEVVSFKKGGIDIKVAVNISVQNLAQPSFVYQVRSLLAKHGLTGESLELELTENSLMNDIEGAIVVLSRLAKLGITLSIDDFGTGYSSLQYLQKLPVSLLKIDQSFVGDLGSNEANKHIVDASIELAHKLNYKVVAEGVEDEETLIYLRNAGCDFAQGFLISRALPAKEFSFWHRSSKGRYSFSWLAQDCSLQSKLLSRLS